MFLFFKLQKNIQKLKSTNSDERISAADALGALGPKALKAVPALIEALEDSGDEAIYGGGVPYGFRDSAANALDKIGALTTELKVKKCFTDLDGARKALLSFQNLDHDLNIQPTLKAVPGGIADDLANIGKEAIPFLLEALENSDFRRRAVAYYALIKLDALTPELKIKRAIAELNDPYSDCQESSADTLGEIGSVNSEIVQALIKALGSTTSAAKALGKIGPVTPEIVPALIEALEIPAVWRGYVESAAQALGKIGPVTPEVVPALINALTSRGASVAAQALGVIGPVTPEVVPSLITAMEKFNYHAIEALSVIGPVTPEVVPSLIRLLDDADSNLYASEYVAALGNIGPVTPEVVPALFRVFEGPRRKYDKYIRREAAEALVKIGSVTPEVAPSLTKVEEWLAKDKQKLLLEEQKNKQKLLLEEQKKELKFFKSLLPEVGPAICAHSDCSHKTVKLSMMCAIHHFEIIKNKPCPWNISQIGSESDE